MAIFNSHVKLPEGILFSYLTIYMIQSCPTWGYPGCWEQLFTGGNRGNTRKQRYDFGARIRFVISGHIGFSFPSLNNDPQEIQQILGGFEILKAPARFSCSTSSCLLIFRTRFSHLKNVGARCRCHDNPFSVGITAMHQRQEPSFRAFSRTSECR